MRYNNFENFWEKFKEIFRATKVSKENAQEVFEHHYSTFNKIAEGDIPYLGEGITYTSESQLYYAFHEGGVYLLPSDQSIDPNTEIKGTSFSAKNYEREQFIKTIEVKDGNLHIEYYAPEKKELITKKYDSSVVAILSEQGVQLGNIDIIENYLAQLNFIPDEIITVKEEVVTVENIDGTISEKIEFDKNYSFYSQACHLTQQKLEELNNKTK